MTARLLLLFALTLVTEGSLADWARVGAASRCDPQKGTFELAPVIELSQRDPGEVPVRAGFKKLKNGRNLLSCQLDSTTTLQATILVHGAGQGQCMGGGYIDIRSMMVDGTRAALEPQTAFNHDCLGNIFMRLTVRRKGQHVLVERCSAEQWQWGTGFSGVVCATETLR